MSEEEKERLVISTRKSLYDPVEIEIDGQVYLSQKATHAVLDEINKLDAQITAENDEPIYKIVEILYGVKREILDKLDKREVEDIYFFTKKKFQEIDKQRAVIIASTFGTLGQLDGQQEKKTPPNQRRPGGKA